MQCPECNSYDITCIDTRAGKKANEIRRRRKCTACGHRWTTAEIPMEQLNELLRVQQGPGGGKLYRKAPVIVEALQFTKDNYAAAVAFTGGKIEVLRNSFGDILGHCISTLEGDMAVVEGDYIIKGVKGEFYPCKPDIFERTYDLYGGAK